MKMLNIQFYLNWKIINYLLVIMLSKQYKPKEKIKSGKIHLITGIFGEYLNHFLIIHYLIILFMDYTGFLLESNYIIQPPHSVSFCSSFLKHLTDYEPPRYRKKYLKPNQSVMLHSNEFFKVSSCRGQGWRKEGYMTVRQPKLGVRVIGGIQFQNSDF